MVEMKTQELNTAVLQKHGRNENKTAMCLLHDTFYCTNCTCSSCSLLDFLFYHVAIAWQSSALFSCLPCSPCTFHWYMTNLFRKIFLIVVINSNSKNLHRILFCEQHMYSCHRMLQVRGVKLIFNTPCQSVIT